MTTNQDLIDYFIFQCEKGFIWRGLDKKINTGEYRKRLEYEKEVIIDMGFPGYFLVVQDFLNWARKNGVLVGVGRGSIGGALAAYCMNITQVDPVRYGLIFERFLNEGRAPISIQTDELSFDDFARNIYPTIDLDFG